MTDDAVRFWRRVAVGADGECWPWKGRKERIKCGPEKGKRIGYGRLSSKEKRILGERQAHRIAWALTNGPIPEGMNVLHHCDNPPCCNPADLFLGDHDANMADMVRKGRARARVPTSDRIAAYIEIKRLRREGRSLKEIMRMTGESKSTLGKSISGAYDRYLPNEWHGIEPSRCASTPRKLTAEDLAEMARLYAIGYGVKRLTDRFKLNRHGIRDIVRGKAYRGCGVEFKRDPAVGL
jgi:HNH endonuclease